MALQLGATRDAFLAAGAPADKASAAAEELAGFSNEFTTLRGEMREEFANVRGEMREEFSKVRGEMRDGFANVREEFSKVRGEINLLRWMIATNGALTLAVFVKLFIH